MHDEFRLQVQAARPRELLAALKRYQPEEPEGAELGRLAVTNEQEHVFVYADSLAAAQQARQAVERMITANSLQADLSLWRWHPEEERWEDASTPLPEEAAQRAAEHAIRERRETEESLRSGYSQWEVRISLPSHHDARSLAERLQGEGIPVVQRWRHLLIGANDEDDANALAERLRAQAPAGSELEVQGNGLPFWQMLNAPARPFTFFGGLAQ
jgi:hypothetical protein